MDRKKILVVEDEGVIALDIESRLRSMGYAVAGTATSGREALEKVRKTEPDIVLLDIKLRGEVDGAWVGRVVRERFDIPVVYLTAYSDETVLDKIKDTEPFGYILKPFQDGELRASVELALYKHRMETLMKKKDKWLSATLNSIGDGVITTDTEGKVTFMNPQAESLTGCSEKKAADRSLGDFFKIIGKEGGEGIEDLVSQALEGEMIECSARDHFLVNNEGEKITVDCNAAPIRDDLGNRTGVVIAFRDVRKRKRTENALQKSEQRFKLISEGLPLGLFETDKGGSILFTNTKWQQMFGLSLEQSLDKNLGDMFLDKDRKKLCREWEENVKEFGEFSRECQVKTPSENVTWAHIHSVPLISDEGIRYIGTVKDITMSKKAELGLRESEEKFRAIVENVKEGILLLGPEGNILTWNRSLSELTGLSEEDVEERPADKVFADFIPDTGRDGMAGLKEQLFAGNKGAKVREYKLRDIDGVSHYVLVRSAGVKIGGREYILATLNDVTELKNAMLMNIASAKRERELRSMLEEAFDAMRAVVIIFDRIGKVSYINPYGMKVLDYREEEVIGSNIDDVVNPLVGMFDLEKIEEELVSSEKISMNTHIPIYDKKGNIFSMDWEFFLWKGEQARVMDVLAIGQDIGQMRKSEIALKVMDSVGTVLAPLLRAHGSTVTAPIAKELAKVFDREYNFYQGMDMNTFVRIFTDILNELSGEFTYEVSDREARSTGTRCIWTNEIAKQTPFFCTLCQGMAKVLANEWLPRHNICLDKTIGNLDGTCEFIIKGRI